MNDIYNVFFHIYCGYKKEFMHLNSATKVSSSVEVQGLIFRWRATPAALHPQPLRRSPRSASCRCAEVLRNFCAEALLRHENIAAAAELRVVIDGKIGRKGSSVISRQPAGRKKLTGW